MKFVYKAVILSALAFIIYSAFSFSKTSESSTKNKSTVSINKMKIQIWSDIMCPFCYIGKRKLEKALSKFEHKDQLEIEWKSYQLNPDLKYQPGVNAYDYLAKIKGQSREWSVKMHEHVTNMAKDEGLNYNFEKSVIANSFNAHRLIQMAKQNGLGDVAEERLFKAYFTEGANMEDNATLLQLGKEIGLKEEAIKTMLASSDFGTEVNNDIAEANKIGVSGVPFFVFNNKYVVSGAQDSQVFLDVLDKSFKEFETNQPASVKKSIDGKVCTPEGNCK